MTPDPTRATLADLKAKGLYRALTALGRGEAAGGTAGDAGPRVTLAGRKILLFASNNYLGLAADPRVTDALRRGLDRWGWGAGASRLLAGHTDAHAALEADLARFMGAEAALVFPTGYMANLGVLTALSGRGDTVVMDRACHASLYDAAALAGAALARYPECDAAAAAEVLADEADGAGRRLLVTDTVFSMDGRRAPLADLAAAAGRAGAMLVADEAHAIGVLGATGAGLAEEVWGERCQAPSPANGHGEIPRLASLARDDNLPETAPDTSMLRGGSPEPPHSHGDARRARTPTAREPGQPDTALARVGTLSKTLGGVGGFVAASRDVIDLLINRARPFIYTTALPPAACEAAREALRLLVAEPERRTRLHALSRSLRRRLREAGFDLGPDGRSGDGRGADGADADAPPTPIVPILLGDAERALAMAAALLERGIFCPAIRPPTVPPGTSRLRVSLTAEHTEDDLDALVAALVAARDAL